MAVAPSDALQDAETALVSGDLDRAEILCRDFLTAHPDDPAGLFLSGQIADQRNNLESALTMMARAIAAATDETAVSSDWRFALADVQMRVGQLVPAVQQLELGLAAAPDDEAALYAVAGLYAGLGHHAAAADRFHGYLCANPTEADAWCRLALSLAELGRSDEAEDAARRALELAPTALSTRMTLATILHGQPEGGGRDEALRLLHDAVAAEPDDAGAQATLAHALQVQGDLQAALVHHRKALALEPESPLHVWRLGHALLASGCGQEALDLAQSALRDHPGQSGPLALRGLALWATGKTEEARHFMALDDLVMVTDPGLPTSFADLTAFHRALAADVMALADPAKAGASAEQPFETGSLLLAPTPAIEALQEQIIAAVDRHRDKVARLSHPFVSSWDDQGSALDLSGLVMPSGAILPPSLSPSSRLTGFYFVEAPVDPVVWPRPDDQAAAGRLRLGRPDLDLPGSHQPETRVLSIQPGRLVLFPSFIFHDIQALDGLPGIVAVRIEVQ